MAPGSKNGCILFGEVITDLCPRGEWGIEYYNEGLNFWKVGSDGVAGANYCLFIKNDSNVGIGNSNPIAKLDIKGSLRVSSLASPDEDLRMIVSDDSGILSLQDIPAGDNLGSHIATRNLQMSGKFITNDEETSTNEGIYIGANGNVGIKTNTLNENDDFTIYAPNTKDANARLKSEGAHAAILWATNGSKTLGVGVKSGECVFYEDNISNKVMKIIDGKIGIGLPDGQEMPGNHKLYVAEGITTEEVKVKLRGQWSDYVFNNDYHLRSINELEGYIQKNKHLPEIPNAEEVKNNGLDLGQMNVLLLKKIEELTLYVIELKNEIDLLKGKNQ